MTTAEQTARPLRRDSVFFSSMALAMAAAVFVGFSQTYYLKAYFDTPALTPLRVVHGAMFTAWIALLILQTGLVAANRRDVHRRLGLLGVGLAVTMVVLGTALAVSALREGRAPSGAPSPSAFFAIPIGTMIAFTALVVLGAIHRARPGFHKRFMMLATVAILPAAIARFPLAFIATGGPPVFFALTDLLIVALAAYDLSTQRRVHPATLSGAALVIVSQFLSLLVGSTASWLALTTWITA
jgi:hypothetical protein